MEPSPVKESEVDVLIIGAGPAGLMAALWMSRCGIKTRVIDKRQQHVRVGQVDGIQPRSLEIFDSFDIVDRIWKESCHMVEMSMWNPGENGAIRRASRLSNTIPGLSRFPQGVLLAQHRIEGIMLESLAHHSNIEVQRCVQPMSIDLDNVGAESVCAYPLCVRIAPSEAADVLSGTNGTCDRREKNEFLDKAKADEVIRAKYIIGCDGAHSWTRAQLGIQMEGEQSEYIWGVLDVIPITNFPDIRTRCAIHSASAGSIMLIPREDRLVRIYCQLSELKPSGEARFDRSKINPGMILEAVKRIMNPYSINYKHCDWWSVYQIGQKVGTKFSAHDRIFLAGDAIHTHSPKAGQGMNVSMQDCYNLGWKLALVIQGIAKPSILDTYEMERRTVAKELIEFDQLFSRLWSKPPAKDAADDKGVLMSEFQQAFRKQRLFSSGFAVHYGPSSLVAKDCISLGDPSGRRDEMKIPDAEVHAASQQYLATNMPLGQRIASFKVINHCDARPWHIGKLLRADGHFHIVVFAGDVSQSEQMQRVHTFAERLAGTITSILSCSIQDVCPKASHPVADIIAIHSSPRQRVDFHAFPDLLRPFEVDYGWNYDRIFVDEESYHEGHGDAYKNYGIDKVQGCVVVVRPDQHVAWIGSLEDVDSLETYFANFLVASPKDQLANVTDDTVSSYSFGVMKGLDGDGPVNGTTEHTDHGKPTPSTHSFLVYNLFKKLQDVTRIGHVKVDGERLDIPTVVAVSGHNTLPSLDSSLEFTTRIADSVALLNRLLGEGKTIYGVNTGYGGSADTRSNRNQDLQSALLQHHHFGVLTSNDRGLSENHGDVLSSHAMPQAWVKGTMLVRCNSIARGHSAVSLHVIETIIALLRNRITPIIPLRGSISASGDLSPLSYVAGTITGNPDIYVESSAGIVTADKALQQLGIPPIILGPKEGLGLMNGTATSAAAGSLVLYETHQLAVLSQLLSAMALEALLGTAENYDPFIAEVRPHRGQVESARNIRHFLRGSRLGRGLDHHDDTRQSPGLLYQDRYALRTASQWIGPQLEDLLLAHEQITVELNSTTDNPLVDVAGQTTHHGGNFQAASITSAMEKTRLSLQMLGKMLFAQCSELINPMLNNGLPPNLAADEPSLSFTMKGVDIGMAAYMSEISFLANPVSSHVQSAEMHNQAINSLAFISARYTFQAVELASLMSASYLYTVCQALDLRVLQVVFFEALEPALYAVNYKVFGSVLLHGDLDELHIRLWEHTQVTWLLTTNKDSQDRVTHLVDSALAVVTRFFIASPELTSGSGLETLALWKKCTIDCLAETYADTRARFFERQNTADYLGQGTRKMYIYIRETLGVPLHRGLQDHPTPKDIRKKLTIGSWIAVIYEALRDGRLHEPLMESLVEAEVATSGKKKACDKVELYNGWVGLNGKSDSREINQEEQREVAIVEGKRRHSVTSQSSESARRRSSLAMAHGSLTGL